jgi:hypothetical protein
MEQYKVQAKNGEEERRRNPFLLSTSNSFAQSLSTLERRAASP